MVIFNNCVLVMTMSKYYMTMSKYYHNSSFLLVPRSSLNFLKPASNTGMDIPCSQ